MFFPVGVVYCWRCFASVLYVLSPRRCLLLAMFASTLCSRRGPLLEMALFQRVVFWWTGVVLFGGWEWVLFFECGRGYYFLNVGFLYSLLSVCVVYRFCWRCIAFELVLLCWSALFFGGGDIVCQTFDYSFIVSSLLLRCFVSAFSHRRCLLEVRFILVMGVVFQAEGRRISGAGSFFSVGGEWM